MGFGYNRERLGLPLLTRLFRVLETQAPLPRKTYSAEYGTVGTVRYVPVLSHGPWAVPPFVLTRCTVVTPERIPLPRRSATSSLSHGMSLGVAPNTIPTTLPTTKLPSVCSQVGPA